MSRFSGQQQSGAARELQARRRVEAEARQRAEAERDRQRAASQEPVRPLNDREMADLITAVNVLKVARILDDLARIGIYQPGRTTR